MSNRRYRWTPEAQARAARHGVTRQEAVQALAAPVGMTHERFVGDMLIVMGMAHSGRVIAVICNRVIANQLFEVFTAVPLAGEDLARWEEKVK